MTDAIRNTQDLDERKAKIAELDHVAAEDQRAFAEFIRAGGGSVTRHLWAVAACVVEIPPGLVDACRRQSNVRSLWPNVERRMASLPDAGATPATNPPMSSARDANNHNIDAAWAIPGLTNKGEGITVAFFDSGIDLDNGNAPPHNAFWADAGQSVNPSLLTLREPDGTTPTRVFGSFLLGTVDCNSPGVQPFNVNLVNADARHGTGVAGVAVGGTGDDVVQLWTPGHAPRALLVGWSITNGNAAPGPRWTTNDGLYLAAIQGLRAWELGSPNNRVDILNISFDGTPDPENPVNFALDQLAEDLDILIVTAGSNDGDSTLFAHGAFNVVQVGAVHKRSSPTEDYVPMALTVRGPMVGEPRRLYPDVCATGAGFVGNGDPTVVWAANARHVDMPLIDRNAFTPPTDIYSSAGTSMAAPQVSGAAALYRARRRANGGSDTAVEARAAILLNVDDPYSLLATQDPPAETNTYRNRNTFGVGYVRDDFVVQYAERLPSIQPLEGSAMLDFDPTQTESAKFAFTNAQTAGAFYAVVAAWNRSTYLGTEVPDPTFPVSQFDLEVFHGDPDTGGTLIAHSRSPVSSFERVVFRAPSPLTSTLFVRVIGEVAAFDQSIPVFVAGRLHPGGSRPRATDGTVESIPQPPTCVGFGVDQAVIRTIPTTYTSAYGSRPFNAITGRNGAAQTAATIETFEGIALPMPSGATENWNIVYDRSVVGGASVVDGAFTATGLALRTWLPFAAGGTLTVERLFLYETLTPPSAIFPSLPTFPPTGAGSNPVPGTVREVIANPVSMAFPTPTWSAADWGTWPVIIPFDSGQTFTFTGDPTHHLGVTVRVSGNTGHQFDGVEDGTTGAYSSNLGSRLPLSPPTFGRAPILGIIGDSGSTTAHPVLTAFGEPAFGQTVALQITSGPKPVSGPALAAIHFGFSELDPPQPAPLGCLALTTVLSVLPVTLNPMGDGILLFEPDSPAFLFQDLFLQAVVSDGVSVSASNALVLHIGGIH